MLWYKAWRESRTRFLIAVVVLTAFCLFATMSQRAFVQVSAGSPIAERIHHIIYAGTAKGTFAILSIFLGLGGLLRERAQRTSVFTMALPVTRARLMRSQITVGMLELAFLSLIPAMLLPLFSIFTGERYSILEALPYSLLWFVCGSLIFAVAYLLCTIMEGEYTAAVACYILLMLQSLIAAWSPLRPYQLNIMWTMTESHPVPWLRLLMLALLSSGLFIIAIWRIKRQDF